VRVPTDFSSNISKLVSMNDLSMYGYNSNDCHVIMMVFLTIAIRAIKPVHVKVIITCLCYFFNTISQKVIGRKELDDIRAYIIETMCMLEMCFTPFFDMQQHLMIHLVDQIHTLGPLYLHSMFRTSGTCSFEVLCVESCPPRGFYYGRLHNRRGG
jgi:hypothetical protein